jgi:hypothetical protein
MFETSDKASQIGYQFPPQAIPTTIAWWSKSREEPWREKSALPRRINDKS